MSRNHHKEIQSNNSAVLIHCPVINISKYQNYQTNQINSNKYIDYFGIPQRTTSTTTSKVQQRMNNQHYSLNNQNRGNNSNINDGHWNKNQQLTILTVNQCEKLGNAKYTQKMEMNVDQKQNSGLFHNSEISNKRQFIERIVEKYQDQVNKILNTKNKQSKSQCPPNSNPAFTPRSLSFNLTSCSRPRPHQKQKYLPTSQIFLFLLCTFVLAFLIF